MLSNTTFRVEEVLSDPEFGEPLHTRQRGVSYATLTEATRAATGIGQRWLIVEAHVVAQSPEVKAIMQVGRDGE